MISVRVAGVVACLVLMSSAVAGPVAAIDPTGSAALAPADSGPEAGVVLDAAAKADGAIGAYFDAGASEYVVVYPAGAQPSTAALVRSGVKGRAIQSAATPGEIDAIAADLVALAPSLVDGQSFGFSYEIMRDLTVISSTAPRSLFAVVLRKYPGRIAFESATGGGRTTRASDPAPHRGGAVLTNTQGSMACSSGFSVHRAADNKDYMLTAGHCFLNGQIVFGADGMSWGTVQWRALFPAKDMEMIGGKTYTGAIYGGGKSGTLRNVVGAGDGTIGSTYCQSGITSFETCNHVLLSNSATYCDETDPPVCTPGLAKYTNWPSPGDSGGPYYLKYANGTVAARGIIIAALGTQELNWGFAHKWSTLASTFGVSIISN